jgi:ABC-2 type transport system permease protein
LRTIVAICVNQLRLQFSQRSNLMVMFVMPILFTLIFGKLFAGGGSAAIGLAVVDLDRSVVAQRLTALIQGDPSFSVQVADEATLATLVEDRKIEIALLIPAGYGADLLAGNNPPLEIRAVPGGNSARARLLINQHSLQIAQAARVARVLATAAPAGTAPAPDAAGSPAPATTSVPAGAAGVNPDPARVAAAFQQAMDAYAALPRGYAVTTQSRQGASLSATSFYALGFSITFLMMSLVTMTGVFLEERNRGTWQRILTTPATRGQVLAGYLLSFVAAGWIQFGLLMGLSHLLFGVQWGSFPPLAAVVTALIIAISGLGLFLAGLVKSAEQQRSLGGLLANVTSMLGGVYWSLDLVGPTMQKIAYLTPQAWAMDGLREVMLRGGQWEQLALPIAVLLGMGLLFTTAGLARVRYA